jgi:hypothetical protein
MGVILIVPDVVGQGIIFALKSFPNQCLPGFVYRLVGSQGSQG